VAKEKSPYRVKLSADDERALTVRLVEEVRAGKRARALLMDDGGEIDFYYSLYEQRSQKGISRDTHRYGEADLTSPIITENVDTLVSRFVASVFKLEPLWIVEGIGDSAKKSPVVEQFMQWRQEEMRLQQVAKRGAQSSFVETGSIIEVCEDAEETQRVAVITANVLRAPDGSLVLDAKTGKPLPELDEEGVPVEAPPEAVDTVEVKRTYTDYRRRGAYPRCLSMKDFLFLPSHARDTREVWGHAARFWMRMDELTRGEEAGKYRNLDQLGGDTQERQQTPEMDRAGVSVETVYGFDNAEKELWRLQVWCDIGKGLSFYTVILSEIHDVILSIEQDWLQSYRTVYLNPYPCSYSVYGYSMAGTKLLTTAEEHTAWRNMNADRETLGANAPMKRRKGTEWDPRLQPFGAGRVIDLTNMDDVQPMEFKPTTPQAMQREQQCPVDAQRIIGINDLGLGQNTSESRTLGENRIVTTQSFVRTDDPISNLQEAFEEVGALIHAIEVQTLKDMEGGIEAPARITSQLTRYGDTSFKGTFTADMISGQFRFKPRGSSDQADPQRRQQAMVNGVNTLLLWAKANPALAQRLSGPEFADVILQWYVSEFKPRDVEAFLKPTEMPPPPMPMGPPPQGQGPGAPQFGGQDVLSGLLQQLDGQGAVQ
jgi:hypothetical protein